MNNRQKKKIECIKRKQVHELFDLVLDINGLERRKQNLTGNLPTTFFNFAGHVAMIYIDVHKNGWHPDSDVDCKIETYLHKTDMAEAIAKLEEIKRRVQI